MLPTTRHGLIAGMQSGEAFEFFFFWRHTPPKGGGASKSCLSQWFQTAFTVDGVTYRTAEHWMMAEKARLFGDREMLRWIVDSDSPKDAEAPGRKVQNFDEDTWDSKCFEIVVQGTCTSSDRMHHGGLFCCRRARRFLSRLPRGIRSGELNWVSTMSGPEIR